MFNSVLNSVTSNLDIPSALLCIGAALIFGVVLAVSYRFQGEYSQSFMLSLILLPAVVAVVIMMVNGDLGVGVAVAGAFTLVRFRSLPGSSKEICFIFLAMATGLACGMGYLTFALLFTAVLCVVFVILSLLKVGETPSSVKSLRVTIPESLDYTGVFDDIFDNYTKKRSLDRVKTTNLGSMFELSYTITLKNAADEKKMIDEIRCRNGNLTVVCGKVQSLETL